MKQIEINELRFEFLETVIKGVSSKVNKKALKEVIEDNETKSLNGVMFEYYQRINSINKASQVNNHIEFVYREEFENNKDFEDYIKETFSAKRYKTPYNYKHLGKVKQRNTGLFIGYYHAYGNHYGFYAFDCNQYAKVNNLTQSVFNAIN
jgi:hypothetical protein